MNISEKIRDRNITPPTAQLKYNARFGLETNFTAQPHRVTLDTKLRKFQCKLFKRCLATNVLLSKIGIIPSPSCTFCREGDESLRHIYCNLLLH